MKKNKILILVGAPGSGKSTFAKYHLRTEENWFRVCRDDLRLMQFSNHANLSAEDEMKLTKMVEASVEALLKAGSNVLVDATHTKKELLNKFIDRFTHQADIEFKVFDEDFDTLRNRCDVRNDETGKYIPKKVLVNQYESLQKLKENFDFSPIKRRERKNLILGQDMELPLAIICDLDGTLAHIEHRNPFDASNCEKDALNGAVADVVKSMKQKGVKVILFSGRMDEYRVQTERWLSKHEIEYDLLEMRKTGDVRKDSIVKYEMYNEHVKDKYNIHFVLDDRNQVVEMWRNQLGLKCFQVAWGDF